MKHTIYLLIFISVFLSCSEDDDNVSVTGTTNKFIINNTEYVINKAISYTEANDVTQDFYYFDITFLTSGVSIGTTENFIGNGSLFEVTFINETNTFLSEGEYLYGNNNSLNSFDLDDPWVFSDYDFAPSQGDFSYDYSLQDGFYDQYESATFTVSRQNEIYTITGSGIIANNIPFSLEYTGSLEIDPDSE